MPLHLSSSSSPWHRHLSSSTPMSASWLFLLLGRRSGSRRCVCVWEETTVTPFVIKTKNLLSSPCVPPSGCTLAAPQPLRIASWRCFIRIWCGPDLPFFVVVASYDGTDKRTCWYVSKQTRGLHSWNCCSILIYLFNWREGGWQQEGGMFLWSIVAWKVQDHVQLQHCSLEYINQCFIPSALFVFQSCSLHIIYCVKNDDSMRELPFSYLSTPIACCSCPVMSHSARLGFTVKKGEAEYEL